MFDFKKRDFFLYHFSGFWFWKKSRNNLETWKIKFQITNKLVSLLKIIKKSSIIYWSLTITKYKQNYFSLINCKS